MKIKNLFISLIAAAAAFVGCTVEGPTYLNEVKVSSSFVTFGPDGGTTTIDVTATDHWTIKSMPNWVSISPMEGNAGTTKVTFSAEAATDTHEGTLYIECAGAKQTIKLLQQCEKQELPIMTVAEIMAAGEGTYRAKGVCSNIYNTTYGNWHLIDETGDMTIYGTLDATGAEKNFLSLGINEGDIVTVEGPYTLYNGVTPELVNVTVIAIEKSLIKVDSISYGEEATSFSMEGGNAVVNLTNKGNGVSVVIPESAQSWLGVAGVETGVNVAKVTLSALPNNGGDRKATITFKTSDGKKEYTAQAEVSQVGAIVPVSAKEFNAAPDGDTQYRISGIITKIANTTFGNIYVKDFSGEEVYVYGTIVNGESKKFETLGVKEGDIIELVGPKSTYNSNPQMVNGAFQWSKAVTPATAAEVNAMADDDKNDPKNYVLVKGKVTDGSAQAGHKFDLVTYGNFDLVDESGDLYVYGVTTGWNGESKKFASLGVKEGDIITIIGYKTSYNGTNELVGFYVSHEEGKPEPEPEPETGLAETSWYQYSNDKDGGFAILTFMDEENCYFANGDKEGIWWEYVMTSAYTYDATENLGSAFDGTIGFQIGEDGKTLITAMGSFEKGEYVPFDGPEPEPEPEPGDEYTTTITYTLGSNSYDDGVATINGVENVKVLKTGTSKAAGEISFTIPAGKSGFSCYAVAWKGNEGVVVNITLDGQKVGEIKPEANNGATGNSPYTITFDGDKVEIDSGEPFAEDTTVVLSCDKRVLYFGVKAI